MAELEDMALAYTMRTMSRSAALAAFSIQVFEWAVNLTSEVELIHRANWSFIKLAYILCRYCPLVIYPVTLWAYVGNYDQDFCAPIVRPVWALFIPLYLFPHVVMLLRAYAFSGRRKFILILLSLCFMALCTVTIYAFYTAQVMPDFWYQLSGKTGCFPSLWGANILQRLAICIMTTTSIDLVSLIVVIIFCLRGSFSRQARANQFLKQGLFSFAATAMVSVTATIMIHLPPQLTIFGVPFTTIISNVMACRVILQLRASLSDYQTCPQASHSENKPDTLTVWDTDQDGQDDWVIGEARTTTLSPGTK